MISVKLDQGCTIEQSESWVFVRGRGPRAVLSDGLWSQTIRICISAATTHLPCDLRENDLPSLHLSFLVYIKGK